MRAWLGLLVLLAMPLASACDGAPTPVLTIELIDPATGGNPALDVVEGTLEVRIDEGGVPRCGDGECRAPITRGEFVLDLPIQAVASLTRVQASIEGGAARLEGASPPFGCDESLCGSSVDSLDVRVPMLLPGACQTLTAPNVAAGGLPLLTTARRDAGVAVRRNIALVVGGVGADGPDGQVDRYDMATTQVLAGLDPLEPLGPTRGLTVSSNLSLFVGNSAHVFRLMSGRPPGAEPIGLHDGASARSALVRVDDDRFAVVGGDATDALTWLTRSGVEPQQEQLSAAMNRLLTARTDPAVGVLPNGDLLVLGGQADGAPSAERVPLLRDGVGVPFDVPAGQGGWLVASGSGRSFLWVGRTLPDGSAAVDTVLLTGCPDCAVAAGPDWTDARLGASATVTEAGVLWIVGGEPASTLTDRAFFAGDTPALEPGPPLSAPRGGASVVEHASGVVAVLGGQGDGSAGLRDDLELCLAASGLDPF